MPCNTTKLSKTQKKSARGSGVMTDAELTKGFRLLGKPKLRKGQKPVAFPGVPEVKS